MATSIIINNPNAENYKCPPTPSDCDTDCVECEDDVDWECDCPNDGEFYVCIFECTPTN